MRGGEDGHSLHPGEENSNEKHGSGTSLPKSSDLGDDFFAVLR